MLICGKAGELMKKVEVTAQYVAGDFGTGTAFLCTQWASVKYSAFARELAVSVLQNLSTEVGEL